LKEFEEATVGEVLYDYYESERRRRAALEGVEVKTTAPRMADIRAQVQEARVRLAEQRGRDRERARWLRATRWGTGAIVSVAAAFVLGWAFARMLP
jgi:hypothetical protein